LTEAIENLRRAAEEDDIPASIDAHLQFHRLFYDLSGHAVLRGLWNGWEAKQRLYLSVDHRSYAALHEIGLEHERLAAVALDGDTDAFRRELAQHFPGALQAVPSNDTRVRRHDDRG
jgi:DNA-binding GntR family transcriptional regulator